jgi:hypothetical protein
MRPAAGSAPASSASSPCRRIIRTIGLDRARTKIGFANLDYNFKRLVWSRGRQPWRESHQAAVRAAEERSTE